MMVNKRNSFTSKDDLDYDYGAAYDAEPNSGHEHSHTKESIVKTSQQPFEDATPIKNSRNSWEENDSDDELYPADAYTYGRDDDDDDDDDDVEDNDHSDKHQHDTSGKDIQNKAIDLEQRTFDQGSDDEKPPNRNHFLTSASNPRASVNSSRSYSSHTKHHSFGHGQDRPEHSESESESNSESESDQDEKFINAPSSPAPPILSGSRPSSTLSASYKVASPGSSTLTRSTVAATPSLDLENKMDQGLAQNKMANDLRASSPPTSPSVSTTAKLLSNNSTHVASSATQAEGQLPEQTQSSLPNPLDKTQKRASGSESDTSNSSGSRRSPLTNGHLRTTSRSGIFPRSISGASATSRGPINGHLNSLNRSSSYSDMSDAELNDISLDDHSAPGTPRRSFGSTVATPRAPVAPSNAGFPSSFFGGKPHPKSQQFQVPQPNVISPQPVASVGALSPTLTSSSSVLNGSISSLASSIQGAFMGRGFGGNGNNALPPPPPVRTPSGASSTRPSITGMMVNTSNVGIDLRPSNNISPERASTYSTMTTDSNMDLLLARLEAENSMLEQDNKRRLTIDSEMDRALGHAKEESVEEDVDWDYWGALMHDYNGVVKKNPKQLTQMIQKGVPPALRGLIWQLLAKSKDAQLEASYAELLKATSQHEKQINRDMSRTFPNHEYFQAEGLGQESMFNVVKAYSLYDKEVGYCQGLSFVVGPLLLNMPDEEAFCVLVRMMTSYELRGHYTPEMNMLQLRLFQFEQLMEEIVPMVYRHFQNQGIRSTMYASQWFMTLFAYKFPLDLVFRIYDILFVEGVESILRFAIALLKANQERILNHDFETLIEYLKNGLFDHYKNNPSLFVQDAYNVKVTPRKLAQYAQKYNNMVQKQQAELAAEESLRDTNRQLSSHVRRLEGSLHTLNKEHVELAKELIARKMDMAHLQDQNDVLNQKVSDLTKIVDSQAKEVEDRLKDEIQSVMQKNVDLVHKNEQMEDQCNLLESLLIETKMKYAESENERDSLTRKLADLRKALGA
ncbi:GTPase-activating protein [Mortierella sp. AM989]|nr:GTPase-activating protein [Mortierella sp. AM989]